MNTTSSRNRIRVSLLTSVCLAVFMCLVISSVGRCETIHTTQREFILNHCADCHDEEFHNGGLNLVDLSCQPTNSANSRFGFRCVTESGRVKCPRKSGADSIPVGVRSHGGVLSFTVVFWGSTLGPARPEAYDSEHNLLDETSLEAVPGRNFPGDPLPTFELTVEGTRMAYIEFSDPREGEYLAADEVRFRIVDEDVETKNPSN